MTNENEFDLKLREYIDKLSFKTAEHYRTQFPTLPPERIEVIDGSQFVKIIKVGQWQRHVYCFIVRRDNETKSLGKVKQGDLMKPASWKTPAKHARGNIIEDCDKAIENSGPYGVVYLK
jgi:hypothetical protein